MTQNFSRLMVTRKAPQTPAPTTPAKVGARQRRGSRAAARAAAADQPSATPAAAAIAVRLFGPVGEKLTLVVMNTTSPSSTTAAPAIASWTDCRDLGSGSLATRRYR